MSSVRRIDMSLGASRPSPPTTRFSAFTRSAAVFIPDRKSTRLNSSHPSISYAVFCLKKKKAAHTMRKGRLTSGADVHQAELSHQHDEVVKLVRRAIDLEAEGIDRSIAHANLEDAGYD